MQCWAQRGLELGEGPGRSPHTHNNGAGLEIEPNPEHQDENNAQGSLGGSGAPEKMGPRRIFLISGSKCNGLLKLHKALGISASHRSLTGFPGDCHPRAVSSPWLIPCQCSSVSLHGENLSDKPQPRERRDQNPLPTFSQSPCPVSPHGFRSACARTRRAQCRCDGCILPEERCSWAEWLPRPTEERE